MNAAGQGRGPAGFDAWFGRTLSGPSVGLVAREVASGQVAGVVNLTEIVTGAFQSAYLGYYGMAALAERGLMTEAVRLATAHAFEVLGLHRLEANIQPGNLRSIALVKRLGFRLEGFSPRYLRIDGQWPSMSAGPCLPTMRDPGFGASHAWHGEAGNQEAVMAVAPIAGLFEAHLTVSDLDRSVAFYRDVLGLELAHTVPKRHAAFFWVGGPGAAMLGLWSVHSSPLFMRLHVAFRVALPQIEAAVPALRGAGIMPRSGGGPEIEEPVVIAWMPATSVYFDDPDRHSLEYLCMLPDAPRPDLGRLMLSEWRARVAVGVS